MILMLMLIHLHSIYRKSFFCSDYPKYSLLCFCKYNSIFRLYCYCYLKWCVILSTFLGSNHLNLPSFLYSSIVIHDVGILILFIFCRIMIIPQWILPPLHLHQENIGYSYRKLYMLSFLVLLLVSSVRFIS